MTELSYEFFESKLLGSSCPIGAKISDHRAVIKGEVLSFNMMMQGRYNAAKRRYNNGFALVESQEDYQARIRTIVRLLAEIVHMNPQINIIGLEEAPINAEDITAFIEEAKLYKSLAPFIESIHATHFSSMGIATFFNLDVYHVTKIEKDFGEIKASLKDRVQEFVLMSLKNLKKTRVFNLHLPYDLAKSRDTSELLAFSNSLFAKHDKTPVVALGDFNIHPDVISKVMSGVDCFFQADNNILTHRLESGEFKTEIDTVDCILQSSHRARGRTTYSDSKTHASLSGLLLRQHGFFGARVIEKVAHEEAEYKPRLALMN